MNKIMVFPIFVVLKCKRSMVSLSTVRPTPKLTNYIEFFFIVGGEGILRTFFFLKLHYQSFFVSRCYRDTKLTNLHLVVVCSLKITGLHSYFLRSVSMLVSAHCPTMKLTDLQMLAVCYFGSTESQFCKFLSVFYCGLNYTKKFPP